MNYELLLINTYRDTSGYSESFNDSIGQYLIASYLRKHDFVAQVYAGAVADCQQVMIKEIEKNDVKTIGFYAAADNVRIVKHAICWLKEKYKDVITIVGGPQAIDLDISFFMSTGNDYVIVGEGEIPMLHLMSYLVDGIGDLKNIPQIKYYDHKNNCVVWNQCDNAVIANLDEIPFPRIEDSLSGKLRNGKMVGIITGRGCPNQCAFCYEGANAKNVRFRSIQNVMEEIDYIVEHNPNVEYFNIYDDTFTLYEDRVIQFCCEMKKRGLKWFCEGHVSFVNKHPHLMKKMVDSGLTCIQFGIESGSNLVLDTYKKNTNKEAILQAIKICKESGIHGITGNFIIGGAKETKQTLAESRQLAKEMLDCAKGIMEIYTVYFAPYPNTKMVSDPSCYDIEIQDTLMKYNINTMRCPVIRTKELSTVDIYREKIEFDDFLAEQYKKCAFESSKSDIMQGLFQEGKRIHINPTWENVYALLDYVEVFLWHTSAEEQVFNKDAYMIRTFEDFVIENDRMITKHDIFDGAEKDVLLNASGLLNGNEMASMLGMTLNQLEEIYNKLNNRCLVYITQW